MAVVLLTMMLIQLRKRKQYTDSDTAEKQPQNAIYDACPNPAYGGKFYVNYY